MDTLAQLQALDQTALTPLVRQALGSASLMPVDWQVAPRGGGAGRCVYRFTGRAQDQDRLVPWSLILKDVRQPEGAANPSASRYWKREMLAYQSGLLATLPAGLRTPRCLGIVEHPGGGGWLWLEEITDAAIGRWTRERFTSVARLLGTFNAAYLTDRPLPAYPWLSRGWFRSYAAIATQASQRLPLLRNHPLVRPAMPGDTLERALRVWHDREAFFDALDHLPQTFCHLDAHPRNLFVRHEVRGDIQIVAIDWEFAGVSALGADLGQLMGATLLFDEADLGTVAELEEDIFASYLQGLDAGGWRGDPRTVRLGYATTLVLHQVLLMLAWVEAGIQNAAVRQYAEEVTGRTYATGLDRMALVFDFLLTRADEARRLMRSG